MWITLGPRIHAKALEMSRYSSVGHLESDRYCWLLSSRPTDPCFKPPRDSRRHRLWSPVPSLRLIRPAGLLPPVMAQSKDPQDSGSSSSSSSVEPGSSNNSGEHVPPSHPPPRRNRHSLRGSSSPWTPPAWTQGPRAQMALRVAFNVLTFYLLMRIWPFGGGLRVGEEGSTPPNADGAKEVSVKLEVPFSDFVRNVKHNEVRRGRGKDGTHWSALSAEAVGRNLPISHDAGGWPPPDVIKQGGSCYTCRWRRWFFPQRGAPRWGLRRGQRRDL